MIEQRPPGAAPAVQATAEALPFAEDSFDASMAVLTIHHWTDLPRGIAELLRVARNRVVIMTFDPEVVAQSHTAVYAPEIGARHRRMFPSIDELLGLLPNATVEPLPLPKECKDRFTEALWARPEQLLDPVVRRASSVWHDLPGGVEERAMARLRADLESGAWQARYGHLLQLDELDVGVRLVVAELS
jgi:SAM-dependent methyltransferase